MPRSFPKYETLVWIVLIVVTCASWEITRGLEWFGSPKIVTSVVFVIAFVKTRFVLLDFMELKHAPLPARLFAEAWWAGNAILLLALYLTSAAPTA